MASHKAVAPLPSQKIELSDIDVGCIKIMAGLGMNVPDIAAMLRSANGVKISARTLFNLKRTDPRVQQAFDWAAGRINVSIARKLFSVATNDKTDRNIAFRACKYWECSRGGIKDPERRSVRRQSAAIQGRVVIGEDDLAPSGDRL